ncbi:MAG: ABC transporter ATP-binding protein [Egibacteraceae bacterium]
MTGPAVACRDVAVAYGRVLALDGVDLLVEPGEAVALLGPSGAGKSTLLHLVAGFVSPTRGEVDVAGQAVATPARSLPPERRQVGVVFQHYALWPHMTAVDTVAYPLRRRGARARDARRQARLMLERMGIAELAERRPAELSGGQQQRVGLARALAREASVYLFDEPTAHLDTALRATLQEEMSDRRRALGAAAVYATHDAGEALAVADRVVLLRTGRVVQSGGPREIYEQPADLWAAQLTGPASLLDGGTQPAGDGQVRLHVAGEPVTVPGAGTAGGRALVRPDWVALGGPLPATVDQMWYRGTHTDYRLDTPLGFVDAREPGPPRAARGTATTWALRRVWLID